MSGVGVNKGGVNVSIGFDTAELKRALMNVEKWSADRKKAVKDAINSVGLRVESEAKERCPVNKEVGVGGRLRASIHASKAQSADDPVYVSTDVEYAAFVEFGTGRRGAASGTNPPDGYAHGTVAGMRAQPYLVPAMESNRRIFEERLKKALKVK